ncbi:MAG: glycosyltransferase family 4 protein [Chloroflexota bacterium]
MFVCLDFYPDDQAASQLFTDLMVRLAQRGTKITVLCGFPMGVPRNSGADIRRHETLAGISIHRCGFHIKNKHRLAGRAVLYGSFLVHAAWKLLGVNRETFVFGVTSPPFCAHLLWATSRLAGFRYGYMFLDLFPEALIALGKLSPRSPLTRAWKHLNGVSYRSAARLGVLGRDMIPVLRSAYGIDAWRVRYIPHWSAAEVSRPVSFRENDLARRLGLDDKFVVQYSGNMGLLHDIDALVRAADQLRDDARIHFLFIGKGRRRQAAEELTRELGLRNVTWLTFVPRDQLNETLSCCHAALVSLRASMEGVAVPSKLYGILAFGRPVVAQVPAASEIAMVIREEGCGLVAVPGDVEELASAIRTLSSSPMLAEEMGARAFAAYQRAYTVEHAVSAFQNLLPDEEGTGPGIAAN